MMDKFANSRALFTRQLLCIKSKGSIQTYQYSWSDRSGAWTEDSIPACTGWRIFFDVSCVEWPWSTLTLIYSGAHVNLYPKF